MPNNPYFMQPDETSSIGKPKSPSVPPNAMSLPWSTEKDSVFWGSLDIRPERWDKIFPYRLLVIDVSKPGKPSIIGSYQTNSYFVNTKMYKNGTDYVINEEIVNGSWQVTLPITPQQLKITDQFAINTSATMRGIVEEHNGIKFKMISASGTTGIWPTKPTKGGSIGQPSSIASVFGGTVEAFGGVAQGISSIANSFSGNHPNSKSPNASPEDNQADSFSTGYYQALYLGQFFERYAEAKRDPANKGWRLVFDIPKQNQSFIVTPVVFELSQSEQKPNQMLFNFQLKAWKRIDLEQSVFPSESQIPRLDANVFQRIVNTIAATRRTLGNAQNLVKAVRSDFQNVFNVLRQTSLAVKDAAGLAVSVGDLHRQIIKDLNNTVEESWLTINRNQFPFYLNVFGGDGPIYNTIVDPLDKKHTTSTGDAGPVLGHVRIIQKINEGLSREEVAAGALGSEAAGRLDTDPLKKVFDNPETNFDLFDSVSIDGLNISPSQQKAIDDELLDVRTLEINDFRRFKQAMVDLSHDIADNYGAGNETYSSVYGLPTPKTRAIPMTVEENEILQSIFESIQAYDLLTATKQYDDLSIDSALDFVGGLANESGINFEDFSSKLLVPVPFGATIEEIAARYMGDSSKWLEIVTLNKLRSPYIDETGFSYNMLSNPEGRQFNVDDTSGNLFIGQKITIVSDTVPPITRKIINFEKIGDGDYLVTVDGLDDLDVFQTSDNARMQGYLPGTVNSQNQIYMPLDAPSDPDDRTFSVANVPDTALNKLAKIDFLLTDNFDIAINSTGDFRLASGLTNLIQALKLKIKTQKGSILKHLEYGIGLTHGISVADINNGAIIKSLNAMVAGDSRFQSIDRIQINLNGSTMRIDMTVRIANGSGILPISFDVRTS